MTHPDSRGTYTPRLEEVIPSASSARAERRSQAPIPGGAQEPGQQDLTAWRSLLDEAADESQVILLMREYVAGWAPEQLVRLPQAALPVRIADRDDINDIAFELARAHCRFDGASDDEQPLLEMLAVITHATMRLARIAARRKD